MNDLFDRPVVILETDRSKSEDGGHANAHPARNLLSPALTRTKYIDALVSQLTRSKIQVKFHPMLMATSILRAYITSLVKGKVVNAKRVRWD